MRGGLPTRSMFCTRDEHDRCPHWTAVGVRGFWRGRPAPEMWLCDCDCHAGCPLAGRRRSRRETWDEQCRCTGAMPARASFARAETRRQEGARVMADVDLSGHPSAEEVERRLRAAYVAHNRPVPPVDLTGWSRIIAAGTGPRGTRRLRLLGMGARAVERAVRWAWQPAAGDDEGNRQQLRSMYRVAGVLAGLAALLSALAVATSGWRRLPWWLLAALSGLASAWTTAIATAVTQVARSAAERRDS